MYFEFSTKKLTPLTVSFCVLTIGVLLFSYANTSFAVVNRAAQYLYRMESNIAYSLFYKIGGNHDQAAAAIAFNNQNTYALASSTNALGVPVLVYHGTPPEGNNNPPLPQSLFIEHLRSLKADGWQTITLEQFRDFIKEGKPVPPKSFLLTFDDGRKESFYPVDPVLKDLGYTAVMFVITGFSMREDGKASTFYLDKTELQYMIDSGRWELESHGAEDHQLYDIPSASTTNGALTTIHQEHFLSNRFWLQNLGRVETKDEYTARVTADLRHSNAVLENTFGKRITAFAYPFNDYGQNTHNFPEAVAILSNVVTALYDFAFYQIDNTRNDPFNYPDPNAYLIKRIEPTASWSGAYLVNYLDKNAPKSLPYQNDPSWAEWSANWGDVAANGGVLELRATDKATGATTLLNGSQLWKDYQLRTTIDWKDGNAVSLVARYQTDSKPFISCAFTKENILLAVHDKGKQETVKSASYTFPGSTTNATFSMKVSGSTATCTAYGTTVSAQVNESFLHNGNAGIQIWDPVKHTAAVDVKNVVVIPVLQ